jgi:hypothetical protein
MSIIWRKRHGGANNLSRRAAIRLSTSPREIVSDLMALWSGPPSENATQFAKKVGEAYRDHGAV